MTAVSMNDQVSSAMPVIGKLDEIPRHHQTHAPTPLELMPNLTKEVGKAALYVKRDDCTGLGMGGNKVRQLEFYLGEAVSKNADTVLITGALQSNFARLTAASARRAGMDCHIQVEERVSNPSALYRHSGNIMLSRMLGATLHSYPSGEDEEGADRQLEEIADGLRAQGRNPYVIHLSHSHPPLGSLGYVIAARELLGQMHQQELAFDKIVVPSGSGATHAGLLFGLRALGCKIPVKGICVRRSEDLQISRIISHCNGMAKMLGIDNPVNEADIELNDNALPPGYGKINDAVLEAINLAATREGIILDPVYSGRNMAGFLEYARESDPSENLLFIHTGGQPAVFAYEDDLKPIMSESID